MQIVVADISAQQAQGLQFRTFHGLSLNPYRSGTANGTGKAALVGDVVFLRQGFTADLVKVFILSLRIVFGGQNANHLHGTDQARGTHPGQLLPGQGMLL